MNEQARRSSPAESSSFSYGPTVRLRLLPTSPFDDAVTFGYGVVAYSDTDSHRANVAPSRAHSFQHGALESRLTWMSPEASLRTWMPAIHAGMTKICIFHVLWPSVIMNHFVQRTERMMRTHNISNLRMGVVYKGSGRGGLRTNRRHRR
jgi:hypothetical protein